MNNSIDMKDIAKRIKEVRVENKMNQSEFGKSLFVSQDTISLWETGKSLPNTEALILICKKYDISADYILGLDMI